LVGSQFQVTSSNRETWRRRRSLKKREGGGIEEEGGGRAEKNGLSRRSMAGSGTVFMQVEKGGVVK